MILFNQHEILHQQGRRKLFYGGEGWGWGGGGDRRKMFGRRRKIKNKHWLKLP